MDALVVVPSTKQSRELSEQRLYAGIAKNAVAFPELAPALRVAPRVLGSPPREYDPTPFAADEGMVRGSGIVLVDDTWITGRRIASAFEALRDAGSESVIALPIARSVEFDRWRQFDATSQYHEHASRPWSRERTPDFCG